MSETIDVLRFKKMWESRNPQHENNLSSGLDMFWQTAELVAREYVATLTPAQPVPVKPVQDENTINIPKDYLHRAIKEAILMDRNDGFTSPDTIASIVINKLTLPK